MEIRVRDAVPADAAAIARIHVDTWHTTYAGIVPAAFLAGLSYAAREQAWSQTLSADLPAASMLVAETEAGVVIGFVAYGAPEREGSQNHRGEVSAIYVLEEHQRKGIGRRLFLEAVQHFSTYGITSMQLWVLKDNLPARRFYKSMGGEYLDKETITIGGAELEMVSYGWRDIAEIAPE